MKNLILFLSFIFVYTLFADEIVRTEVLSDGWKFRLEEEAEWRNVNVPHDWGMENLTQKVLRKMT